MNPDRLRVLDQSHNLYIMVPRALKKRASVLQTNSSDEEIESSSSRQLVRSSSDPPQESSENKTRATSISTTCCYKSYYSCNSTPVSTRFDHRGSPSRLTDRHGGTWLPRARNTQRRCCSVPLGALLFLRHRHPHLHYWLTPQRSLWPSCATRMGIRRRRKRGLDHL